jgi:hypothetical protein
LAYNFTGNNNQFLAALHGVHASRQREVCSSHPRTPQGKEHVLHVLNSVLDPDSLNPDPNPTI